MRRRPHTLADARRHRPTNPPTLAAAAVTAAVPPALLFVIAHPLPAFVLALVGSVLLVGRGRSS
jgi:hypothetical protein